jgi:regulator of Ty1 transposition protein 103
MAIETESILTNLQLRRHADRTAQMWMQRIKESPSNKKLSLIYLANGGCLDIRTSWLHTDIITEIVQQAKIRKKEEFIRAYEPIMVEATSIAYKGSPGEAQNKIRRVVEVWRQRAVFNPQLQQQIEGALDELDKNRSSRKPALGGSLFSGSSVPPELTPVAPLATSLQKADIAAKPALTAANQEYDKLTNINNPIPTPPMHAAGLAALVKKLATAEGAVAESIKARQSLINGLEMLLETNKAKLSNEQAQLSDLATRKTAIENRKREVEQAILKGLSAAEANAISSAPLPVAGRSTSDEAPLERPRVEELTPPPMESFTPTGSPDLQANPNANAVSDIGDDIMPEPVAHPTEPIAVPPSNPNAPISAPVTAIANTPNQGSDFDYVTTTMTHADPADTSSGAGTNLYTSGTYKKRKMGRSNDVDEFAAFEGDGDFNDIDANIGGSLN